ncbi:MAG TPA: hypothetical protein VMR76_01595 [Candidatus Saccharimonadia bacterium]|nr:hypothetical protein [Candidatus Saccharimonadia bacterium]
MTELIRPQPYIGISGIARYEQHEDIVDLAIRERLDLLGYFIMIGVQATGKTQVLDVPNKRGQMWHPVGDTIAEAAGNEDSGLTKPYIHAFFDGETELAQGVINVMRRTRHYVRGFQFNGLAWVDHDYRPFLHGFKEDYPDQSIILQAGSLTLDNHSSSEVAASLETMPVDYMLVDPSGGYGREMDVTRVRSYVDEVYQRQIPISVGVSGGLEAQNVEELIGPLMGEYPGLSCDAEGRLRKGPEGLTVLDMEAVEAYIIACKETILRHSA